MCAATFVDFELKLVSLQEVTHRSGDLSLLVMAPPGIVLLAFGVAFVVVAVVVGVAVKGLVVVVVVVLPSPYPGTHLIEPVRNTKNADAHTYCQYQSFLLTQVDPASQVV
jgi:hypothetical protein